MIKTMNIYRQISPTVFVELREKKHGKKNSKKNPNASTNSSQTVQMGNFNFEKLNGLNYYLKKNPVMLKFAT